MFAEIHCCPSVIWPPLSLYLVAVVGQGYTIPVAGSLGGSGRQTRALGQARYVDKRAIADAISCQNTSCNLLEVLTLRRELCKSHGRILIGER